MNVMMIRSDLNLAGPGVSIHRLSHQLRDRGINVTIVSGGGTFSDQMRNEGFRVYEFRSLNVGKRSVTGAFRTACGLRRILIGEAIDVVHGHNIISTMLTRFAGFGLSAIKPRFFTSIHGKGKEWLFKYLPGTIVGVSQDQLRYVEKHAPNKPSYCLYSSNPWIASIPKIRDVSQPLRLISVGHFTGFKGQERLVVVAKILRNRGVNFKLSLVGDGPKLETVKALVRAEGLQCHVATLGRRSNIRDLFEKHDLFVHLPDYETFGIVCQEALCSGLPVVAARVGGIPEIVADPCFGGLVDLTRKSALSEVADEIVRLGEPKTYTRASASGREHVKIFASERIIAQLIDAYNTARP